MSEEPVISCKDLGFCYAGSNEASLSDVNIAVPRGQFVVVSGRSGSGKTTLARCLNGLAPNFFEGKLSGNISILGKNSAEMGIAEIGGVLATVFQDPRSQFFMTETDSELAFGVLNRGMGREEALERVESAYEAMAMAELRAKSLFALSSGQLQKIAIGSCWAVDPDLYLFDEPSANLDMPSTLRLANIMKALKDAGKTVLVFEHRLFYLADLLDRLLVFDGGRIVADYPRAEALSLGDESLAELGLRAMSLDNLRLRKPCDPSVRDAYDSGGHTFEICDLAFSYERRRSGRRYAKSLEAKGTARFSLGPMSACAHSGEIIAIIGENGAGKTTLARICCGLEKEGSGRFRLNGRACGTRERLGRITLIMQDSDYQLFSDSVAGELSLRGRISQDESKILLLQLGLGGLEDAHPQALSRGQKQRLTIACAVASDAEVFFFDEPTSGLDGRSMLRVSGLVRDLGARGKIVFLVSHDPEFLAMTATRLWLMEAGTITEDAPMCESALELMAGCWRKEGSGL